MKVRSIPLSKSSWSIFLTLCTIIIIGGLIAGGFWLHGQRGAKVEKDSGLVLDLYGGLHEYTSRTGSGRRSTWQRS